MTTLMRNGRDRRLGKPVKGHAILEHMLLVGTRSADHISASGHSGCIAMETPPFENRPDTWLHPNASQKGQIHLAPRAPSIHGPFRHSAATPDVGRFRTEADINGQARPAASVANDPQRKSSAVFSGRVGVRVNDVFLRRVRWRTL